MTATAAGLVENVGRLTAFPDIAFKVDAALGDDLSSAADIGALIEPDPALTASLLRIANSAAYGRAGTIDNIERAVSLVGAREIRDLTFAVSATKCFEGMPNDLVTVRDFWQHSLYCGVAAQTLAKRTRLCSGISLFTAGMLHDIGQLVMFNQCPERSIKAIRQSLEDDDGRTMWAAERDVFGFDHTEVGAALATSWNFPEPLRVAIQWHHQPTGATTLADVAMIVHAANSVAVLGELKSTRFDDAPPIDPAVRERLGLGDEQLLEITDGLHDSVSELLRALTR